MTHMERPEVTAGLKDLLRQQKQLTIEQARRKGDEERVEMANVNTRRNDDEAVVDRAAVGGGRGRLRGPMLASGEERMQIFGSAGLTPC